MLIPTQTHEDRHMAPQRRQNPTGPRTSEASFRVSEELKARLRKAASDGARTLSQEIAHRLDRSFDDEDRFGGACTYALCRLFVVAMTDLRENTGQSWHSDRFAFEHAVAGQRDPRLLPPHG